ncbi:S1 RNA-binding domain-containing protein [Flavobacterium sp. NRK F7]|uniref:CvfB family protein n=1 Tax=Flavobacterium sp. NRK F7 TaxID=2954930 RepID=UPI0020919F72|nr:S1-like domain-containing RNA-binding protein [Flavobacterium sp. NRK F7]MCO6162968.1 S1-like domain-containing RNA-binding protein [Flavobacterium sp. NRK F7]
MLQIGQYNTLKILRNTKVGLFLGDGVEEQNDVLLPNKYVPREFSIGDELTVFVYLDHEERPVATTLKPYIKLNEFAHLKVNYINKFGAFMNWGLEKDLFVPFKEQARPMEEGKRYLVYCFMDEKTNRLVGSSKTQQFLNNEDVDLENGEEVNIIVSHITEAGINVIINEKYRGLAYKNEVFEDVKPGLKMKAYIKNVRPDGKIDVSLRKLGVEAIEPSAQVILDELKSNRGFLGLNDNSNPEDIRTVLKMSKKVFKKAVGNLYRQKMIEIKEDGIYLIV